MSDASRPSDAARVPSDGIPSASGEWQVSDRLTESVLPVIALIDGEWQPSGTGFIISRGGLMLTAGHVIPKKARRREGGRWRYDGLFLAIHTGPPKRLFGLENFAFGEHDDVAVGQLQPVDGEGPFEFIPLKLRPVPPRVGEEVLVFGYDALTVTPPADLDRRPTLSSDATGCFSAGRVTAVHWPRKPDRLAAFPCFDFAAELRGGMSGGPVFNKQGFVCGVASHSPSWDRSATAAGLALVLGAEISLREGVDGPARATTLYELMQDGIVSHDGSLAIVRLERFGDQVVVSLRG